MAAKSPCPLPWRSLRSRSFQGKIVLAASQLAVLIRLIGTIPMPSDRLERLLRLELSQHADEHGDLAADYAEVPLLAGEEVFQCCCIGQVAPMKAFLQELAAADCKPDRVHAPAFALGNILSLNEHDTDDSYGLLIDIGAQSTRMVLRKGSAVLAAREVAIGGDTFTEFLAKARELHFERAEVLKRERMPAFTAPDSQVIEDESGHRVALTRSADKPAKESDDDDGNWLDLEDDDSGAADDLFAEVESVARAEKTTDYDIEEVAESEEIWLRSDAPHEHPKPELEKPGTGTQILGRSELGPGAQCRSRAIGRTDFRILGLVSIPAQIGFH